VGYRRKACRDEGYIGIGTLGGRGANGLIWATSAGICGAGLFGLGAYTMFWLWGDELWRGLERVLDDIEDILRTRFF
jgi:hypothetical protein